MGTAQDYSYIQKPDLGYQYEFATDDLEAMSACLNAHGFAIIVDALPADVVEDLKQAVYDGADPDRDRVVVVRQVVDVLVPRRALDPRKLGLVRFLENVHQRQVHLFGVVLPRRLFKNAFQLSRRAVQVLHVQQRLGLRPGPRLVRGRRREPRQEDRQGGRDRCLQTGQSAGDEGSFTWY